MYLYICLTFFVGYCSFFHAMEQNHHTQADDYNIEELPMQFATDNPQATHRFAPQARLADIALPCIFFNPLFARQGYNRSHTAAHKVKPHVKQEKKVFAKQLNDLVLIHNYQDAAKLLLEFMTKHSDSYVWDKGDLKKIRMVLFKEFLDITIGTLQYIVSIEHAEHTIKKTYNTLLGLSFSTCFASLPSMYKALYQEKLTNTIKLCPIVQDLERTHSLRTKLDIKAYPSFLEIREALQTISETQPFPHKELYARLKVPYDADICTIEEAYKNIKQKTKYDDHAYYVLTHPDFRKHYNDALDKFPMLMGYLLEDEPKLVKKRPLQNAKSSISKKIKITNNVTDTKLNSDQPVESQWQVIELSALISDPYQTSNEE